MPHATHKARRLKRSAVPHAPAASRPSMRHTLLLGAAVGFSMLIITGLYAASLRYQKVLHQPLDQLPRWSSLTNGVIQRTGPIQSQLGAIKDIFLNVAEAQQTRAAAAALMKEKLQARAAAASETPETP